MWQLVFASRHRLIPNNKDKIHPKGCVMVMADPSDLGHGKKDNKDTEVVRCNQFLENFPFQRSISEFHLGVHRYPCYMTLNEL